jgi:hypothetical protein
MSFSSLLTKRCSWRRRKNAGTNEYGEIEISDVTLGSDVPCSRQMFPGISNRRLVEYDRVGSVVEANVKYFLNPTDIQEGDIITFEGSETEEVKSVRDAAGRDHHLEIIAVAINPIGESDKRVG